jgi:hypothetical protein
MPIEDLPIEDEPDARLAAAVADVVRVPRVEPADSMVLHAPLELAARAALLPFVIPAERTAARGRLADLARSYAAFGAGVSTPATVECVSVADGAQRLADAITAGDLADVDGLSSWLGRVATPDELRSLLAEVVVPRLSAAAHGSIFLYLLPRVSPRGELTGELLRPLARELARAPEWRLGWYEDRGPQAVTPGDVLLEAVAATPRLGVPGSDFIYPLMAQAEESGVARDLLAAPTMSVPLADGARALLRAAAWSMLGEPDDFRPYGWSHCLTMPQAVLGIASACSDPSAALAVAATYVVGFRAALAVEPLSTAYAPPDPSTDLTRALAEAPTDAAAAVWHAPASDLPRAVTALATHAATHRDAHLVKYTLACLDAAAWDRTHSRLYLAAAGALAGYWAAR